MARNELKVPESAQLQPQAVVLDLAHYTLEQLSSDREFVLHRGHHVRPGDASPASILLLAPVSARPSRSSLSSLQREYSLRAELDPAHAARPLALVETEGRTTLVLEDPGGTPLDKLLDGPMEVERFLRLAIGITRALGHVHNRELVHKDIKPANILVDDATGHVWLTGFGIASRLPRERQSPEPPEFIAGTLPYMAPEQTGRMNRSIDSRSDLYALGVTLYEMLTGALPFNASEPMEWVHCHIARRPMPPGERAEGIPAAVSAIVVKLLAKTAEERYQTAAGLEHDLRHCLAEWEAHGRVEAFPLGEHDTPDRLLIPEKLYGREREVETLLAAFDRVVKRGTPELVLVSGYSGIGKSSVVNELHKMLVPPRGLFASGKFDQYKRDIPYATLAQAFQNLVRGLLAKSEADLGPWRDALREALGPNGQLMVDLVPELKLIIGEQPPAPELPPQDAQRRFQLVFRRLIGVFARREHPLTLFLDDLQWLDAATLDLLEDLFVQRDVAHLLLIGAYRDNEVTATHPLMRKLEAVKNAGAKMEEITLAPLAPEHLEQLIADALRGEAGRAAPLAQLVHEKTGGNPFFAIQFVSALAEEGLLTFDHGKGCWSWDLNRIHAKGYTDNVVELLVGRLNRLPPETQSALQQLACLGNIAEITLLSIVLGTSESALHSDLWEAVRQELVERAQGYYRFVHDRVQEAAYSLIPEALRAQAHLRIGRLLAAHTPPQEREEAIFELVNQFNRGAALISSRDERSQLAEFNLIAGKRAKASTAYASALNYFITGAALLADDCWERLHELAFSFELHRAECEFLTGALAAAEERLDVLSARAANTVERASVAGLRMDLYTTLGQSSRAVAVGLAHLQHFGIEWSPHPTEAEARREYERIWSQLGDRAIEELIDLPLMSDGVSLATLDVLTKLIAPASFTNVNLLFLTVYKAVTLSLERGNCDCSCFAYVMLGTVASAHFGDYDAGFRFGRLGVELVERGLNRFQARTYIVFAAHVSPWTQHVRSGRETLRRGFEIANKSGDLTHAAYSCVNMNSNFLLAGDPLVEVQREAEDGLEFAQKTRYGLVIDRIATQLGLIRTLRGLTRTFGSFDDEQFDELRIERRFADNPELAIAESWYWVLKLQARFLAGDYAAAIEASSRAQQLLWTTVRLFERVEYHFYGALSCAAICRFAGADQHRQHVAALAAHYQQLQVWAQSCPENFENRAALVGAEIARIEGRELDAERLYEQAIRSARDNGFVHNEALANELAARFYAARGFEQIAQLYLRNARHCYVSWGADGKVRQLDEMYPHLAQQERTPGPVNTIGAPVEQLDLATVLKVSQAVSGEIVLEQLIDTLMRTALEHAGAGRGLLIAAREGELQVEAEAITSGDKLIVHRRQDPIAAAALPQSIVNYVIRTREAVILDDGCAPNEFSGDAYLQHARSVLCLPLMKQGRVIALLYLENNLAPRVFTPARIAVLKLLASEAATSLENSRLYRELEEREAKIRRLIDSNIIGVVIAEFEGDIIEANDAFLSMVGYSREDVATGQLRWRELTPIEWLPANQRGWDQLRASGSCELFEKEYIRKDGSRVPALVAGATFDDTRTKAISFVLDLTERKRAETELRASEARFRRLTGLSADWYWQQDENLRFTYISRHAYEKAGYPAALSIGKTRWELSVTPLSGSWDEHRAVLAARQPFRDFEFSRIDQNGGMLYTSVSGAPVFDERGAFKGYDGVASDITARKRAEQALREAQDALARVNRVSTLGVLAASIAHEVNQPLGAMVTSAASCARWLAAQPPDIEKARRSLERIERDGQRAGEIIHRIRALVKRDAPRREWLDLNETILEVIALTRDEVRRNDIALETRLAQDLQRVQGDRIQLQQVILNLIVNAVEAMSAIGDRQRHLTIASMNDAPKEVRVEVRDSGPGLDRDHAEKLFEAFYTTKAEGIGMGLSISRSIIEAHGGWLWATANEPRGAVFQFSLPVAEPQSQDTRLVT